MKKFSKFFQIFCRQTSRRFTTEVQLKFLQQPECLTNPTLKDSLRKIVDSKSPNSDMQILQTLLSYDHYLIPVVINEENRKYLIFDGTSEENETNEFSMLPIYTSKEMLASQLETIAEMGNRGKTKYREMKGTQIFCKPPIPANDPQQQQLESKWLTEKHNYSGGLIQRTNVNCVMIDLHIEKWDCLLSFMGQVLIEAQKWAESVRVERALDFVFEFYGELLKNPDFKTMERSVMREYIRKSIEYNVAQRVIVNFQFSVLVKEAGKVLTISLDGKNYIPIFTSLLAVESFRENNKRMNPPETMQSVLLADITQELEKSMAQQIAGVIVNPHSDELCSARNMVLPISLLKQLVFETKVGPSIFN